MCIFLRMVCSVCPEMNDSTVQFSVARGIGEPHVLMCLACDLWDHEPCNHKPCEQDIQTWHRGSSVVKQQVDKIQASQENDRQISGGTLRSMRHLALATGLDEHYTSPRAGHACARCESTFSGKCSRTAGRCRFNARELGVGALKQTQARPRDGRRSSF
jgi:hypothetical protein